MDNETVVPTINKEQMTKLGVKLNSQFEQYKKDRRSVEEQWLVNLRQTKGLYDPDVRKLIAPGQSTAYPKITRSKVFGTVARLMQMLFPSTENNWDIQASPMPDLSQGDLQTVLDGLNQQAQGQPISDETIRKAVLAYAQGKADNMKLKIEDQLDELDYITLARKVVFSGVQYSLGILTGPLIKTRETRSWSIDPGTRQLVAKTIEENFPIYEFCPVWDWYPDLSAKTFEQMDGSYRRYIMSRNQLRELADRPDFMGDVIKEWLKNNTSGNYKELFWETQLRAKSDRQNPTDMTARKYELASWWGIVSGHDLKACGVDIPESQLSLELEANIWTIGNVVIKAKLNPYDEKIRPYHLFVYEDDDINLTGSGLPQVIRDSQMGICESSRMVLDNASVVCGDMSEVNTELLMPGQDLDIRARKVWLREGVGADANIPAVRAIPFQSHIPELLEVINLFKDFADTETALPPPALGDPSQGGSEALRTSGGMSMLMGAAALPIRDTVRNYDRFTTSFISSLYQWNLQFSTDNSIKGDSTVVARGSTSLIAKEVRGSTLTQFAATLTPEERARFDDRKFLEERMRAHDIPLDILLTEEQYQQQQAQAQQQAQVDHDLQAQLIESQIKAGIMAGFKDLATATKLQASIQTDTFNAVVAGVESADRIQRPEQGVTQ